MGGEPGTPTRGGVFESRVPTVRVGMPGTLPAFSGGSADSAFTGVWGLPLSPREYGFHRACRP
mgnify:CR=1 FL=1